MSNVVVFVFLLDNVAGFNNALNETLINTAKYSQSMTPVMQNCDSVITDHIISAVSKDLDLEMVPKFRHDGTQHNNDLLKEQSSENLYEPVLDNSLEPDSTKDDVYIDKQSQYFDEYNAFYRRKYDGDNHNNIKKVDVEVKNETKVEFPKSEPFLVAIFETLSNITAQTCAGTLLSPRWVLTAANCVNILSNLYANNTNITESSQHTVVAGSTNPLLDGSVHNVTSVLYHPEYNYSRPAHKSVSLDGPYLALMRIVPEVEAPTVQLMEENVTSGDVMVYGWVLSKNESDHEILNRTSMSALIVNSAECHSMYSYKNSDVICLFNDDRDKNITQFSSGGPVLMVHNKQVKMLAVVQTDEHLFVAYPLQTHVSWINKIISSK